MTPVHKDTIRVRAYGVQGQFKLFFDIPMDTDKLKLLTAAVKEARRLNKEHDLKYARRITSVSVGGAMVKVAPAYKALRTIPKKEE